MRIDGQKMCGERKGRGKIETVRAQNKQQIISQDANTYRESERERARNVQTYRYYAV